MTVILLPCSGQKIARPDPLLTIGGLPAGNQNYLMGAWTARLMDYGDTQRQWMASELYTGRGFQFGLQALPLFESPSLYVISAGLGLVPGDRLVPSYGLTLSEDAPREESLPRRVVEEVNPRGWWRAVTQGHYSVDPIVELDGVADDRAILVALTAPYARLVAETLLHLKGRQKRALRIFGRGLDKALPEELHGAVVPYNPDVDRGIPGIALDYPQRALLHYARQISPYAA